MRTRLLPMSPVAGALLVALGLGVLVLRPAPAHASPATYYFTSVNSRGYLQDLAADSVAATAGSKAPAGSDLLPTQPTGSEVTAVGAGGGKAVPGSANMPTFKLEHAATVTSMCVDVWISASAAASIDNKVSFSLAFSRPGSLGVDPVKLYEENFTANVLGITRETGAFRVTKLVEFTASPKTLPARSDVGIFSSIAPDFTLYYNSAAKPSSITFNPTTCGTATPSPTGTGSPTASPTGSPSPSPSPSGSPEPCEPTEEEPCDEQAPVVSSVAMKAKATVTESTLVSWAGSDEEDGSGVASYQVAVKTSTGSTVWSAAATTAKSQTLTLKRGYSYKAYVSAVDNAGNRSATKISPVYSVPLDDLNFTLSKGGWTKVASSSCWYKYFSKSAVKGATATRKISSKAYDLVFTGFASGGIVEVYVNGKLVKRVDTYSKTTVVRKAVRVATYTSYAARTITIKVSGTRNKSSKGNYVYFDGLRAVY